MIVDLLKCNTLLNMLSFYHSRLAVNQIMVTLLQYVSGHSMSQATLLYKSKNIFIKMLNNVGMAVPKSYKQGAVHMQQGSG